MAPLATQPRGGIPDVPELDMPATPVQQGKPPVRRHSPDSPSKSLPGMARLSMAEYAPNTDSIMKGLGLT